MRFAEAVLRPARLAAPQSRCDNSGLRPAVVQSETHTWSPLKSTHLRTVEMRTPIVALLVLAASAPINSVIADSTPKRGDVVFAADFEGAQALDGWPAGTRLGSGYQAGQGIVIERPAGSAVGASMVFRPLPIERMRGCLVHFSAMVKAEDVSAKPVSWNGIKVMLVIEMPGGKQHPQADIGTGTFDWRHVVSAVRVPEDAISATLALGLESVTGRVWFDDLKVTIRKPPFVVTPGKVAGPLYKGHDLPRLRGAMVSPGVDAESLRTFGKDWNANLVRLAARRLGPERRHARSQCLRDLAGRAACRTGCRAADLREVWAVCARGPALSAERPCGLRQGALYRQGLPAEVRRGLAAHGPQVQVVEGLLGV